jgi:hypothetical protein
VTSTAPPAQLPTSRNAVHRCATGKRKLRSQALHLATSCCMLMSTLELTHLAISGNSAPLSRLRHCMSDQWSVVCVVVGSRGARDALSTSGAGAAQQHVPNYLWI